MLRMHAKRYGQVNCLAGTDRVVAAISLPSGTRLNRVSGTLKMVQLVALNVDDIAAYGAEIWLLPVFDPDAAINADTLWDNVVPKDNDADTLDLDTGATDTSPFWEPGEADLQQIFNVGNVPEKIWERRRLMTINDGYVFAFQDNQTPFLLQWHPGSVDRIRVNKNYLLTEPMMLCLGVASPALDDTTTAVPTAMIEADWARVKYMKEVLSIALQQMLGLTEAGAETPFIEAAQLLRSHLAPDIFEEDGGRYVSAAWQAVAELNIDHSVPGEMAIGQISYQR